MSYIPVKTRYGKSTHIGQITSSVTVCGVHLGVQGHNMAVSYEPDCQKCLSGFNEPVDVNYLRREVYAKRQRN